MGDTAPEHIQTPGSSPQDDVDDTRSQSHSVDETPQKADAGNGPVESEKPAVPVQKRRRVTRACDECRRKKIKCDGKQPCTHCTVYSYECTYDQPSNRRRNPAPQYIEALETRLQKAEALLRAVLPTIDLDDPKVEARGIDQLVAMAKQQRPAVNLPERKPPASIPLGDPSDEAQLESMVQNTGTLDLDDSGNWDYHGGSSGYAFLRRLRAQMGDTFGDHRQFPIIRPPLKPLMMMDTPRSTSGSPMENSVVSAQELPPRSVAKALCRNALDDCCSMMRPLHQPTFYKKLEKIYSTDPDRYTNEDIKFLPLLYLVMAVGCMFSTPEDNRLDIDGYEKYIGQGYQYFDAGRSMMDVAEVRDLTGIQTVCFMIIFLQSTAKLSTCYALVGIAMRACLRLGLHRNIRGKLDNIEQQQRIRIFWLVWKMDAYVSAMLGLPMLLQDEDVDQVQPAEVDDELITAERISPQPPDKFPLIMASNAHTRMTVILRKVVKYVYPIKGVERSANYHEGNGYLISHARIRELEHDLQVWMDELPLELRPSEDAPHELARVQQLLRMSYAHLQMMMYRPFLHYVSGSCQSKGIDKRTFACAAACVSVSRNIVHITSQMKRRGLLIGAYWFVMYTTYFAIISLVYFCLENPLTSTGREILKDALEGRDTLASLARRSLAADRCTQSLAPLFNSLPEQLQDRQSSIAVASKSQAKKRPPPTPTASGTPQIPGKRQSPALTSTDEPLMGIQRAHTFPTSRTSMAKPPSAQDPPPLRASQTWNVAAATGILTPESLQPFPEPVQTSQPPSTYESQFGNPNLPDLKEVMFPSDNPFAYPNQPMSTLEGSRFTPEAQTGSSMFYPANSNANAPFDGMPGQVYGNLGHFVQQPGPPPRSTMHTNPAFVDAHLGVPMGNVQQMNGHFPPAPSGEYWSQMGRSRSGLSPGINLDELFGSDQYNSIWDNPDAATGLGYGVR